MTTLLIVDDEPMMRQLIRLYLTPVGYSCIEAESGETALLSLEKNKVDLILLDIMMPTMSGWETCKKIREKWETPIIMLTARDTKEDIVKGLNSGADDYISKPFDEEVLIARMNAVLRRNKKSTKISFQNLSLDKKAFQLHYNKVQILLTPKEFELVSLFLSHQNMVFTREHLLSVIWGYDVLTEDRTIDSHIRNIREKLRKVGFPSDTYLQTVWGVGYKWSAE